MQAVEATLVIRTPRRSTRPRRRSGLAARLALLAAGCSRSPETPPAGAAPPPPAESAPEPPPARLRELPIASPREAELAFTVHGAAELGLFARGTGALEIEIAQEGAPATQASLPTAGDLRAPATIRLPGSGSRALRVRVKAPSPVQLETARVKDEEPRLPAAKALVGALRGRSLVVVILDALHAAHLSCHGYERATSPHADALAREGVLFTGARSQAAWTIPSVATLFTGLEQERHGVRYFNNVLDGSMPTLAEAFRAAGYETAAYVQNLLVNAEAGFARGFDRFEVYPGEARRLMPPATLKHLAEPPRRPRFTYVHFLPPHAPYAPPEEFATRFGAADGEVDGTEPNIARMGRANPRPEHPKVRRLAALYDNHVAYADHLLGEVVRTVAAHGRDSTAILFLSDHGEAFAQHGVLGHLWNVHEEIVHVPLILWAPGSPLRAGSLVNEPVWMPDLLPTLAELFGLDVDDGLPGRSLAGLLEGGGAAATRVLRLSALYEGDVPRQRAIVFGRFKLVSPGGRRPIELFDLEADPGETRDVADAHPVVAAALRAELASWAAEGLVRSGASDFKPDAAMQAELKALGYVDDGK